MVIKIFNFLISFFSKEFIIIIIAGLPIVELRGSIPLAVLKFGMSPIKAFYLSIIGNLLPIIPFLFFLDWAIDRLERLSFIGRILKWWFRNAKKKSNLIETYGFLGLILFVAMPFPGTGAWTGAVIAKLFNFRLSKSFFAISLGILIAGIIVVFSTVFADNILTKIFLLRKI